MKDIIIKEVSLEDALLIHPRIEEWDRPEAGDINFCAAKMGDARKLILGAYKDEEIVGYLLAYERNNSFYCWLTAVDKEFRRMGILTNMMNIFEARAKEFGLNKLTIKTVNNKRGMLSYLIKNTWNFTDIIKKDNVILNEILAEKNI